MKKTVKQYPSARGQVRKVSPMQPPPPPPPALDLLANEEELTQLIVILPSGERKTVTMSKEQLSHFHDLLKKMNIQIPPDRLLHNVNELNEVGSEVDVVQEQPGIRAFSGTREE